MTESETKPGDGSPGGAAEQGTSEETVREQSDRNQTGAGYHVNQKAYQGPLETLLELVREKDIDIFEVSLATIADEFLEYVLALEEPDLNEVGTYLVIASQLLVLKSRRLLPTETQEEEDEPVDEQELLLQRLKDYEAFKEAADLLRKAEEERRRLYIRESPPPTVGKREVIDIYEVNVFDLAAAFQRVMEEIGDHSLSVIQGEEYTIDEKMVELQMLLQDTGEMCLTLYLKSLRSKAEVIVTFLALLELMRLLKIRARQTEFFGDIWIYRTETLKRGEDGEVEFAVASDESGYLGEDDEEETVLPPEGQQPSENEFRSNAETN